MTRREYDKLRCFELAKRQTYGRLNRDVETRAGMKATAGVEVIIYDKHAGDVWVQTEPCAHCGVAFGCRVNAAAVDLIARRAEVGTIDDEQIRAMKLQIIGGHRRLNAYTRSLVKDCDAALAGDATCREACATAWHLNRGKWE